MLGIAQTGTGKTASFVLPMLTRLEKGRARARMPRTLILEPTRELAAQVEENFIKYGKNHKLNIALLIGGVSFDEQDKKLERGADVLIATPGRLLDHRERGKLLLNGVEILVIDEADRMLDMGFIPDIERICEMIPFTRQTLFFSATMPPEITKLTEKFLHAPVRVEVSRAASTGANVTQRLVKSGTKPWDKRETLRNLIRAEADGLKNAIIFCNRKVEVSELFRSLIKYDFDAGALHGDMDQRARMAMLASFRDGKLKLLVASDVAARGLDIPDVSHIFNYDVPIHAEDYVHRIGRTARAGPLGQGLQHRDQVGRQICRRHRAADRPEDRMARRRPVDGGRQRGRRRSARAAAAARNAVAAGASGGEKRARGGARRPSRASRPPRAEIAEQPSLVPPEVIDARRERKQAIRSDNTERKAKPERAEQPRRDGRAQDAIARAAKSATSVRTAPNRTAVSASRTTTARSASATTCRPS